LSKLCTELSPEFFRKPQQEISKNTSPEKSTEEKKRNADKETKYNRFYLHTDSGKKKQRESIEDLFKRVEPELKHSLNGRFNKSLNQSSRNNTSHSNSLMPTSYPIYSIDEIVGPRTLANKYNSNQVSRRNHL
jgi:hypothetical protein